MEEERNRRMCWLGDYSYSNLNSKTLSIASLSSMQYGQDLDELIMEVVISDPSLGIVHVLKQDASAVLNHIGLRPTDSPKLRLVFTS